MSEVTRTVPDSIALAEFHNTLPVGARSEAQRLQYQAVSYVWGYQDGKGEEKDSNESWEFGLAYWEHALNYVSEKSGCMVNIPDSFKLWRETGKIERP